MTRRLITVLLTIPLVLTACGRSASISNPSTGDDLILEEGAGDGWISIRDAGSGAILRRLPAGTPSPDWSRYYVLSQQVGVSRLEAISPATGGTLAQITIPSGFSLPQLGQGLPSGLSPSGDWIALSHQSHDPDGQLISRFLVGASALDHPFKTIRLSGDFIFDALSNDGQSLYLIQRLDGRGHYQVRLYDVGSQVLTTQPVVDKREPNEPMNGIRGDSVASTQGAYVFTVYARQAGPFIHALPLGQPFAWCLDLPSARNANLDEQFHWSLAISRDGSRLYAVNGASGLVSAVDATRQPPGVRNGKIALASGLAVPAFLVTDAEAKGELVGGAALSRDERTLFAVAPSGVAAIDSSTLKVRAHYLDGHAITSIRLSTDGHWLYAGDTSADVVWQIDAQTGRVAGEIKNVVNPWAILWAGPRS